MAMQKFIDAFGNEIEVDDTICPMLGPHPPVSPEARVNQITPIRSFHHPAPSTDWRTRKQAEEWGYSNPVENAEYLEKHWGKLITRQP
jgi:hypothetical protein